MANLSKLFTSMCLYHQAV